MSVLLLQVQQDIGGSYYTSKGDVMKKYLWCFIVLVMSALLYAERKGISYEKVTPSMYFSTGKIFKPSETIVILQNATVDKTGKIFTISTTNYIILDYEVPADKTYYSTIIVGGELK